MAKIESAGYSVKAAPAPIGQLSAPTNLSATMGDMEGQCDSVWNPVRGAASYAIQVADDEADAAVRLAEGARTDYTPRHGEESVTGTEQTVRIGGHSRHLLRRQSGATQEITQRLR